IAYFNFDRAHLGRYTQGRTPGEVILWFSEDASELTEVANGLPPGIAFEDGVAALHDDENLVEIVSAREGGCVFRVDRSEHQLSVRCRDDDQAYAPGRHTPRGGGIPGPRPGGAHAVARRP